MIPTRAALASASATAAAAAAMLLRHEQTTRLATERFAAAALETVLNAIDANDSETGAHVRRVATYSLILSDAADLPERECNSIERVALFHDIGKIHEALFDITHDDHKLTAAERRAIDTHPARGAKVLAPLSGFYPELSDGVLSHHERWDGKGYPRGLKGTRIPLSARVVAIADTFDAITYRRRYREGRSIQVAQQVLVEGRGTQFEPDLLDLFLFPPVFARVAAAARKVERWRKPVEQRRTGRDEENVPDINFRWRPGRHAGRGRPASDRARRTAR
ncbi:MAG: HD domain-containing phosphohydrolase [Gemmatimonadaceae bacterium]